MTTETNPDDIAEKACDFLVGILESMGISADIDVHEEAFTYWHKFDRAGKTRK